MATKKTPSLAVGRGEKLPVSQGAGLTAKGRAKYNAATGSNLKAPQPQGGPRKKSFCARMSGMPGPMKDENGKPWTPTDVHAATAIKALDAMGVDRSTLDEKQFKKWRNIGKSFNFMRNYGGGDAKAAEVLEIELEQAKAMNRGYTEAFPLVVQYQKWVESVMDKQGYIENLYGRRYYLNNPNRFYKCANYLIQGSSADMLKKRMIEIDNYIKWNNLKMRMVMCIHDELIFDVPESEIHHIEEIKRQMQIEPMVHVPIVAEVERTKTTWADKEH
jgi:DNA polymerase-1